MDGSATLLWSILFGSVGMGYFVYGKKQGRGIPLLSGAALMIFPYFVSNTLVMVLAGALFIALPFVL